MIYKPINFLCYCLLLKNCKVNNYQIVCKGSETGNYKLTDNIWVEEQTNSNHEQYINIQPWDKLNQRLAKTPQYFSAPVSYRDAHLRSFEKFGFVIFICDFQINPKQILFK